MSCKPCFLQGDIRQIKNAISLAGKDGVVLLQSLAVLSSPPPQNSNRLPLILISHLYLSNFPKPQDRSGLGVSFIHSHAGDTES